MLKRLVLLIWILSFFIGTAAAQTPDGFEITEFDVMAGSHPHDVAVAPDGSVVWYTAQHRGALGRLDPATGEDRHIHLGDGSAPHGVIVDENGTPWITDSGLNAIVSVDPETEEVTVYPLDSDYANLNTAAFDGNGILWFTGQEGFYGRLDPATGELEVFDAPRGRGAYGIDATPDGDIYYASLAGSHIAQINTETGEAIVIEPPTANQGSRRIWSDSNGVLWVSEFDAGQLGRYDPATDTWQEWKLPGNNPRPYSVYVDHLDKVWLTDFSANAVVRFDPETETFLSFTEISPGAAIRQMLGIEGEVWGAESGTDKLIRITYEG